jgi:uncharacterized protein (TIGR02996 family)
VERPARLPEAIADLDEWSVYADWLQSRGDPHGELIALELALPDDPDDAQRDAFAERLARHDPDAETFGYVRRLVAPRAGYAGSIDAIEYATEQLATERCAFVEEVAVAFEPEHLEHVQGLFAALPPACRRIHLDLCNPIAPAAAVGLRAALPAQVRDVALEARGIRVRTTGLTGLVTWIDDRFDTVELRYLRSTWDAGLDEVRADRAAVLHRIDHTQLVRVQWTALEAPFPAGRHELGRAGDAAIVDLRRRCAMVPFDKQRRPERPTPVRARLAGRRIARYEIGLYAPGNPVMGRDTADVELVRRGDRWWLVQTAGLAMQVNGVAVVPGEPVELHDGDGIESERWSYTLITDDVTPTVRALLA